MMEPVRSTLEESLDEQAAAKAKAEDVVERLEYLKRLNEGNLSFVEYQKLPTKVKKHYRRLHGAPKSPEEIRAIRKRAAKAKVRKQMVKRSRKVNLRKGR